MKHFFYTLVVSLLLIGCSSVTIKPETKNIYGNWFTKSQIKGDNRVKELTKKEQFFKNGKLISSIWYNFKDGKGKSLGEYYITREFKYNIKKDTISAKFVRCSTGITKPLKVEKNEYSKLSNICKRQNIGDKISKKRYKLIDNYTLLLGDKKYKRE